MLAQDVRDGLGLALLQFPNLLFNGAGSDQAVGVDGVVSANAVGAVNGLVFHRRIPPGIIENDITGSDQIQTRSGGAEAEEKDRAIGIVLKGLGDLLAVLVSPVRMWVGISRARIPFPGFSAFGRIG